MKRKLIYALIVSQCLLSFSGCGKNEEERERVRTKSSTTTESIPEPEIDYGNDGDEGDDSNQDFTVDVSGLMGIGKESGPITITEEPGKIFELYLNDYDGTFTKQFYNRGNFYESKDYYTSLYDSLENREPMGKVNFVNYNLNRMNVADYDGQVWRNWTYYWVGYSVTDDYDYDIPLSKQEDKIICPVISTAKQIPSDGDEGYTYYELTEEEFEEYFEHIKNDVNMGNEGTIISANKDSDFYYDITDSYPKDEIVLMSKYGNYAWGKSFYGTFVDSYGYVYTFDISLHEDFNYGDELMDILYYEVYYKQSPVAQIEESYFNEITKAAEDINSNAKIIERHAMCDAGETTISVIKDRERVALAYSGDMIGYLDDAAAKETVKLINDVGSHITLIK